MAFIHKHVGSGFKRSAVPHGGRDAGSYRGARRNRMRAVAHLEGTGPEWKPEWPNTNQIRFEHPNVFPHENPAVLKPPLDFNTSRQLRTRGHMIIRPGSTIKQSIVAGLSSLGITGIAA